MKLRCLSVLINNVQKECQKKLFQAERLFSLINQCHRLEFEDEHLLLTSSKDDINQMKYDVFSQIHHGHHCRFEYDSFADELALLWKRFARVQVDLYMRMQEKNSHKKIREFFQQQLKLCL